MGKTKQKKKNSVISAILPKVFFGLIILCFIALIVFLCVDSCKPSEYYECTEYRTISPVVGGNDIEKNLLPDYKLYRIKLNDDNTFIHEVQTTSETESHEYKGTYTKSNNTLSLKYTDYYDENDNTCVFTIVDDTLVREQFRSIGSSIRHTVYQKFEK